MDHENIKFTAITKDIFTSTSMFFNALTFIRESPNVIQGFSMKTDGINNLVFDKVHLD